MLRWLAALLLVPLVDALLLVVVADAVGWQVTVVLVVLTALVGTLLVRAEGRHTLRRVQQSLERGEPPTDALVDAGLLLVAGAFLLTPGLVTDAIGFVLVVPPSRWVVRSLLKRYVITPYVDRRTGGFATGEVYTFGFPGDSGVGGGSSTAGGSGPDPDDDAYDLGGDEYRFEDDDR